MKDSMLIARYFVKSVTAHNETRYFGLSNTTPGTGVIMEVRKPDPKESESKMFGYSGVPAGKPVYGVYGIVPKRSVEDSGVTLDVDKQGYDEFLTEILRLGIEHRLHTFLEHPNLPPTLNPVALVEAESRLEKIMREYEPERKLVPTLRTENFLKIIP